MSRRTYLYRPGHPKANDCGMVAADEVGDWADPTRALDAPIMVDRFREGAVAPDGTPIGTRRAEREWMNATGSAHYDDFKGARERRAKEEAAKKRGEYKPDKQLRDLIGREMYKRKMIL
jgi:hypothetical protein